MKTSENLGGTFRPRVIIAMEQGKARLPSASAKPSYCCNLQSHNCGKSHICHRFCELPFRRPPVGGEERSSSFASAVEPKPTSPGQNTTGGTISALANRRMT